jgi:hypothetical protein
MNKFSFFHTLLGWCMNKYSREILTGTEFRLHYGITGATSQSWQDRNRRLGEAGTVSGFGESGRKNHVIGKTGW